MKRARHEATTSKRLSPILENDLGVIAELCEETGSTRTKEVARAVGVAPPSVTEILKRLVRRRMIEHQRYQQVQLTQEGLVAAMAVKARHEALVGFLVEVLAVSEKVAERDACRIEHVISPQTLDHIKKAVEAVMRKRQSNWTSTWSMKIKGNLGSWLYLSSTIWPCWTSINWTLLARLTNLSVTVRDWRQ